MAGVNEAFNVVINGLIFAMDRVEPSSRGRYSPFTRCSVLLVIDNRSQFPVSKLESGRGQVMLRVGYFMSYGAGSGA